MSFSETVSALEAILFAAGDPVPAERIAQVLGVEKEAVLECAGSLADYYVSNGRGIRLVLLGDSLQLCSAPEHAQKITRVMEQRTPPKLSQPALEVLAIVAYYQPVTRAYIDQVRGVDSSYTVGVLLERGLIEPCGRLDAPGRPTIYRTSDAFLRTMGISSLSELPPLPDLSTEEGMKQLQQAIEALKNEENVQLSMTE
ncbi:MAG: SMC-Scp complex subunit ScpB [Oscillospiraceae bacterium]|jgi:segregation and condensation protein B